MTTRCHGERTQRRTALSCRAAEPGWLDWKTSSPCTIVQLEELAKGIPHSASLSPALSLVELFPNCPSVGAPVLESILDPLPVLLPHLSLFAFPDVHSALSYHIFRSGGEDTAVGTFTPGGNSHFSLYSKCVNTGTFPCGSAHMCEEGGRRWS
jgi:hypothetical protein